MKSNLIYEKVKINKIVFNKNIEESVDFEYQLPDYYTGIFKVLKFDLEPHISSCRVSNKQFIVDGNSTIKLLYIDEEKGDIKSIYQTVPFSKTVDLEKEITDCVLFYKVKTNYKNCKIISPKKLDVKAKLIISVKIQAQEEEDILKSTTDNSLQLKYVPVLITSDQLWNSQQFNINEQIEIDAAIKEILNVNITIIDEENKIIKNKIIAKATANIDILYCVEDKNVPILERTSIPINNIIDMTNIDEKFLCNIKYDVTSINFEIVQDKKIVNVKSDVLINCYANLHKKIDIVTDAFSTKYELTFKNKEFNSSTIISTINENISVEKLLQDFNLFKIINSDAKITDLTHVNNKYNKMEFKAKLDLNILGLNKENIIDMYTKSIPIEFQINNNNLNVDYANVSLNNIIILKILPNLQDDGNLAIHITFNVKGFVFSNGNLNTLSNITLDESKKKEKIKAALTLYYPNPGDNVWKIAKHFCTSPKSIMETNNLESEVIENENMIIIPII